MYLIWIVGAAVLLGIEVHTTAFYAVFIAAGLAAAAIVDLAGGALWLQLVTIGGVSVLGVTAARPPLLRLMNQGREELDLKGVHEIVGQKAITLDVVGDVHHPGHAMLAGERWLAVSEHGDLPPDQPVTVAAVRGTTLVVVRT